MQCKASIPRVGFFIVITVVICLPACEVNVNPGGDGPGGDPTVTFTLAGATILLEWGPAGILIVESGKTTTNVADIVPFERPPDDEPISAVARILPEDVILRSSTVEESGKFAANGAAGKDGDFSGSIFLDIFVGEMGAPRPCETGVRIGEYSLNFNDGVLLADFVQLGSEFAFSQVPRQAFAVLLANGFSVCLRARPDGTAVFRGTLEVRGVRLTFGPSMKVGVEALTDPDPGESQACCWPPLTDYFQFSEPRRQLCEDLAFDSNGGSPREYCRGHGGVWQGAGSSCANLQCNEDFRVCCTSSRCLEYPEEYCDNFDSDNEGALSASFPPGLTCETLPAPCNEPREACCYPDGECRDYPTRLYGGCPKGGTPQGPGSACFRHPCERAACCVNGECKNDVSSENCDAMDGTPSPAGTVCTGDNARDCPEGPSQGACCFANKECHLLSRAACTANVGAIFAGVGTTCPCKSVCCSETGACILLDRATCAADIGLTYFEEVLTCDPNPCRPADRGACCDANHECSQKTQAQCNGPPNLFFGTGTQCPALCPQVGVCCVHENGASRCAIGTQAECGQNNGYLFEANTECGVFICPPPLECCVDVDLFCGPCPRNGSFEDGTDPASFLVVNAGAPDISDWTVTGGVDYIGSLWTSSDGNRSIDLDGTPGPGGISQAITTIPGVTYSVMFDLAGNPEGGAAEKCLTVQAANDSKSYCFNTQNLSTTDMGWRTETFTFTATSASTTLSFDSNAQGQSYFGPALDNVRMSYKSVP